LIRGKEAINEEDEDDNSINTENDMQNSIVHEGIIA